MESVDSDKFVLQKRGISILELYSKIGIALFFLGFNAVYWVYYVNQYLEEEHEWIN